MKKRIVKLADVAKAAKVSQGTASNVFNRPELVRPEVRERVEASADAWPMPAPIQGTAAPRRQGQRHRDRHGRRHRLLLPRSVRPHAPVRIAEVCDERGAGVALVSTNRQKDAAWRIQTAVVDGFIVHCLRVGDRLISLAAKTPPPGGGDRPRRRVTA